MKKWYAASITALFIVLTVVYFRYAMVAFPEALITRHLATDLYEYFITAHSHIELLGRGFVPLGDYWLERGGGYPTVPVNQLISPISLLLTAIYAITGSFTATLGIVMPLFYFTTLITAYWFGTIVLKRRGASIILAVVYTFSMYGVTQLEHIDLLGVQPFVLLTLIFLEKLLASPRSLKYTILVGVFLFLVYLIQLYPFYFTAMFIGFRVVFHLLTVTKRAEVLKSITKMGVLFFLLAIPILLSQLNNIPSQQVKDALQQNLFTLSQSPDMFFLRSTANVPTPEAEGPFYLGLSVIVLLLIPIILRRTNRMYAFYMSVALFFVVYAMGPYSYLNVAGWTQANVPLLFFLRAVGRSMIIGYLGLAVCAAIGFALLVDELRTHSRKLILLAVVVVAIFCDLTIGYEPPTVPWTLTQNGAYEYLREQPEDFRVVEIPSVYLQMATSSVHANHDVLSSFAWAHGYFEPQRTFSDIYNKHLQREATALEDALYGIKYVILNTNPRYHSELRQELADCKSPKLWQIRDIADYLSTAEGYKLVYDKAGYAIYENLLYRGIVFSNDTVIQYKRTDPNTLMIEYDSIDSTTLTISQSYNKGWVATLDSDIELPVREFNSVQQIDVPAGSHSILLHYRNYERWFIILAAFYTILAVTITWSVIKRRRFEKC